MGKLFAALGLMNRCGSGHEFWHGSQPGSHWSPGTLYLREIHRIRLACGSWSIGIFIRPALKDLEN
jgi:hypothetical protein